jgi:Zinc knuckle
VATENSVICESAAPASEAMKAVEKRLEALQTALEQLTTDRSTVPTDRLPTVQPIGVAQQRKHRRDDDWDTCRRCGEKGHWTRECPKASAGTVYKKPANESSIRSRVNVVAASSRCRVRVYMTIQYREQPYTVLLDTGFDQSIIGATSLPGLS